MATLLATLIGGAVLNATSFIGGNYLAKYLSGSNLDEERKRHDLAIEKLQKSRDEWNRKRQKYQDYLYKQTLKKNKAELDFTHTDIALEKLEQTEPVLTDYYEPSEQQKQGEILYIILGGAVVLLLIKKMKK